MNSIFYVLFWSRLQPGWISIEFDSGFLWETVSRSRGLWANMRPYNHIKAKHASLTLKHYAQMDSESQTSQRERELTASVQADFTILGKTGFTKRKESRSISSWFWEECSLNPGGLRHVYSSKAIYKQKHLTMIIILQKDKVWVAWLYAVLYISYFERCNHIFYSLCVFLLYFFFFS